VTSDTAEGHAVRATRWLAPAVFFLLPAVYVLVFARHGISDVDEGFVLACASRVVRGEIPYHDFVWARPPLSLLLHALPLLVLPSGLPLLAGRIGFYLFVAVTSLISAGALVRAFRDDPDARAIDRYLLAAAAFVLSAHDFPPMAWPTVDGLLFASIGVALLAGGAGAVSLAAGSLALVAAALTQQSFGLVALLGPFLAGVLHGRSAALGSALWIGLGASAVLAALALPGLLPAFLAQTTPSLGRRALLESGISAYLNASFAPVLVALAVGGVAALAGSLTGRRIDPGLAVAAGILALFATALARAWLPATRPWLPLQSSYDPQILVWVGASVAASELARGKRAAWVLAALVFVAWASGVGNGDHGPSLFAAPLVFALLYFSAARLHSRHVGALAWLLVVGGALTFELVYLHGPHGRDTVAGLPTHALDSLGTKLAGVRASAEAQERFTELVAAHARYRNKLAVLPGVPLAHFALGLDNPLPLDLVTPLELARQRDRVARALAERTDYVLLERAALQSDGRYEVDFVDAVRTGWPLVESLHYFDVYRNPAHSAVAGQPDSGKQPSRSQSANEP
jgi:hypothetical protein